MLLLRGIVGILLGVWRDVESLGQLSQALNPPTQMEPHLATTRTVVFVQPFVEDDGYVEPHLHHTEEGLLLRNFNLSYHILGFIILNKASF